MADRSASVSSQRRAFSLLEVLIAVALGALIIITAFIAVRAAARAVRDVRRTATENELLAAGWFIASNDADYWMSHASPEWPWNRRPMSEPVLFNGSADSPWDKRPFRPVDWSKVALVDGSGQPRRLPSTLLPHDPEAWYRNGFVPDTIPMARSPEAVPSGSRGGGSINGGAVGNTTLQPWEPFALYNTGYDPTTNAIQGTQFDEGSNSANGLFMPAGWAPWHIQGSSSDMDNVLDRPLGRGATQWAVFQELGHIGVSSYMPAGSPNIVLRPPRNRSVANIGVMNKWYDWGEIPWSLSFGTSTSLTDYSPHEFRIPTAADLTDPADTRAPRRGNLIIGNFGPQGTTSATAFRSTFFLALERTATTDSSGINPYILCDTERATRRYFGANNYSDTLQLTGSQVIEPALLFPTRGIYRPDRPTLPYDITTLLDGITIDPVRSMAPPTRQEYKIGDTSRIAALFTVRTRHIPACPTDAPTPDLSQLPADAITLETSVLRYRFAGGDRNRLTVLVETPQTGGRIEIGFSMLGSSLRGARQHWGWKTGYDRTDLPRMGDTYGR